MLPYLSAQALNKTSQKEKEIANFCDILLLMADLPMKK